MGLIPGTFMSRKTFAFKGPRHTRYILTHNIAFKRLKDIDDFVPRASMTNQGKL
jgi:hypothetical protein